MSRVAAGIVLAGLVIAGGMVFSGGKAEAQGVHSGYTYTERLCQEYGQQPRWYDVRDPIAGSDWRNDGGWAIVLITSSATGTRFHPLITYDNERPIIEHIGNGVAKRRIVAYGTGEVGFVRLDALGAVYDPLQLAIDQNDDGEIDNADLVRNPGDNILYWEIRYLGDTVNYGATYIRWANMAWCR